MAEILGCYDHVHLLVQELARLFLGESVLAHVEQDLHFNGALLIIIWSF